MYHTIRFAVFDGDIGIYIIFNGTCVGSEAWHKRKIQCSNNTKVKMKKDYSGKHWVQWTKTVEKVITHMNGSINSKDYFITLHHDVVTQ